MRSVNHICIRMGNGNIGENKNDYLCGGMVGEPLARGDILIAELLPFVLEPRLDAESAL